MNNKVTATIINLCGLIFILAGTTVLLLRPRTIVAAVVFVYIGTAFLRRKPFGVYGVLFLTFILAGVGLMMTGLSVFYILNRSYEFYMLLIGLAPVILSIFVFYFFTRPEVAREFGLPKIEILEKINKKALIAAGKFLFVTAIAVGIVLLVCYFVAMRMSH